VDATDIGKVLSELFERKKAADDALTSGSRGEGTGSRSNPSVRGRESSKSGSGRNTTSQPSVTRPGGQSQSKSGQVAAPPP
ncbi:hypothetical protein, partial [Staphylococcus aureus]|uniref:hypothetical protein n=1 Tax=Staphylococcus aureus TaxID=1280 RepID=UPI001F4539B5